LRGIQIEEDTYAVMRVLKLDGEEIPLFDSSSPDVDGNNIGRSSNYANFIIQSAQEQRMEKQQIVETFGESYIFFFGERPRFINFTGVLVNTKDFNWKSEFLENYDRYLRGTKLVEQNARLYMYFDDVVVEGYLVQSQVSTMADSPYMVQFQFQMFVCQYTTLSNVGSVLFQNESFNALTGEGLSNGGIAPDTTTGQQQQVQNSTGQASASGGLNSFLTAARQFYSGGITNHASFTPGPTNRPIHEMSDEYVERSHMDAPVDQAEIDRVTEQLRLRTPEEMEKRAREQLEKLGIDTTGRSATALLLGRGAFQAVSTIASFGIRQADGSLDTSSISGSNHVNI
jgi:hypothetical protein